MILDWVTGETHHCLRSIEVILVSSLSAARAVLLVLLAVLLLLLFLYRCGSTIGALCYWRRRMVRKVKSAWVRFIYLEGAEPLFLLV